MNPSSEHLAALSEDTGFQPGTLEKVLRLGDLLSDVSRHPLLSLALALKGGTALNLGFGPPRRLSVDLDFNCIGSYERSEMLKERPLMERAIEGICLARGYTVQRSREEHAGRKLFLGYSGAAGTPDRIEVDLNFVHRLPLVPAEHLELWQPGKVSRPTVAVVGIEELAVGKMCALLDRAAPRDLYDGARLPGLVCGVWSSARFRSLFVAMTAMLPLPLHRYGRSRFGGVTDDVVVAQLHPMLRAADRPSAESLRNDAWSAIGSFVDLSDAEREYVDRVRQGELRLDLLFPEDAGMVERLARHPALLWKAENARKHKASRSRRDS